MTQAAREANERGIELASAGNHDGAERSFREAIASDARFAPAHNNLGLVLLQDRRFYEAAVEFQTATRLDRTAVEPLVSLGRLYEAVGWNEAATAQYERACRVESEGDEPRGASRLASILGRTPRRFEDSRRETTSLDCSKRYRDATR